MNCIGSGVGGHGHATSLNGRMEGTSGTADGKCIRHSHLRKHGQVNERQPMEIIRTALLIRKGQLKDTIFDSFADVNEEQVNDRILGRLC